jgi:sigma-B regulation protein RsbU (phosphoserine phosphatase)
MKLASLLLLFALGTSNLLHAQEFDLSNSHLPILSLDGQWRFHTGDDPAWADPKFDDSKWELLRSDQNWAEQGHSGYSGIAWYRFQVDVPSGMDELSLYLPYILTSYQVFAAGQLIGTYGKMPPHPVPYWGGGWFRSYPFSVGKGADHKMIIAIRVWHWPGWAEDFGGGPSEGGSLIGDTHVIAQRDALSRAAHHWDLASTMILALLQTLAAIGALMLFLLIRSERGYLWFGVMMLIGAIAGWLSLSFAFDEWNILVSFPIQDALPLVGVSLAEAAFYRHLLKGRRTLPFYGAVAGILLILLYLIVQSYAIIDPAFQTGLRATTVNLLETLLQLPLDVWILSLLFIRARENLLDARLLLAPVVLQKLAQLFQGTRNRDIQPGLARQVWVQHCPRSSTFPNRTSTGGGRALHDGHLWHPDLSLYADAEPRGALRGRVRCSTNCAADSDSRGASADPGIGHRE